MLPNERQVWRDGRVGVVVARKWYGYGVAVWDGPRIGLELPTTRKGLDRAVDRAVTRAERMVARYQNLDEESQRLHERYYE